MKKLRLIVSIPLFLLLTWYFLDFAEILPPQLQILADIQLIPALLALNWIVIVCLFLATLIFGRIYCSSVCPLGIYQDIIGWIRKKTVSKKKRKRYKYLKPLSWMRWAFVAVVALAFVTGFSFLVGLLDPYSAFGRIAVHGLKPAYQAGNNLLASLLSGGTTFYKVSIYLGSISSATIALITLVVVGILAWRNGRIYCNTVCPVGTVLGAVSKYSLFQIRFDSEKCNQCGSCSRKCKASCIDFKNMKVDASRCINCFNCLEACSESGLKYRLPMLKKTAPVKDAFEVNRPLKPRKPGDDSRRRFLTTVAVTGWAAIRLTADKTLRLGDKKEVKRQQPIMPPGAIDLNHFSSRCTSCHLCVSKCPSQVIKPSFLEYGIGGIMQPMLFFDSKFCNYDCTICSEVCPTDALLPLTREAKRVNQMGVVQLYLENCIVYTDETSCGACSEHCPTQAVHMVPYKNHLTIPEIEQEICVGCGGCEFICPSKPWKAIFVEGITTHKTIKLVEDEVVEHEIDDFGF